MATIRDKEIKKYRITVDGNNIIIDYVDNITDVLPYSRSLENALLGKYKKQVMSKKTEYYNEKENLRKYKNTAICFAILTGITSVIFYGSSSLFIPIIFAGFTAGTIARMVKGKVKINGFKKQVAILNNVDLINNHNIERSTGDERTLARQTGLFNPSLHDEYSVEEVRTIINEAGGNDYEIRPLKTKVYQKVKSKFKRC